MSFFERIDRFDGPQRSQLRVVPVGAAPGGECYLLFVGGSTLLVDSGFQFCGPQLVEHLRRTLQGRALDYILLTHSHYDHALGSVFASRPGRRRPSSPAATPPRSSKSHTPGR